MLLSVHLTHSGRDEVDYIEALVGEGYPQRMKKHRGRGLLFIESDLNIELKLGLVDDAHRDLDSGIGCMD